ncbi:MAG: aminoacetone oxidase family FAD-binding enzyme [Tissierellia bacterium]|nr:aminoacetone oxidase family FAD-binding enzyme [Tissierellia bacterium]
MEVAIIGGGPSGTIAAIELAEAGFEVHLFERNDRVLKKLYGTGNGRCNYSNRDLTPDNFYSLHHERKFLLELLSVQPIQKSKEYIENLGIYPYEDGRGRIYPHSLQSASVVDSILMRLEETGVHIHTNMYIQQIQHDGHRFRLNGANKKFDYLILAPGGRAYPVMGSDGNAYKLLYPYGHSCTALVPGIGPIKVLFPYGKELKGLKVEAKILDENHQFLSEGDLLFAEDHISGNSIFECSSTISQNHMSKIYIDFLHDMDNVLLKEELKKRMIQFKERRVEWIFSGILHKRLARVLLKSLGIDLKSTCQSLTPEQIDAMVFQGKSWEFRIDGPGGWNQSQITMGGIPLSEFTDHLESKYLKKLYCAGEFLDCHGNCGGYNIMWAVTSALLVAKDIIKNAKLKI